MKKLLLGFTLALSLQMVFGQFTLDMSRMPAIGESQNYQYADTTSFNAGSAGMGQTWDFSSVLDSGSIFTFDVVDPANTPHSAAFSGIASIATTDNAGSMEFFDVQSGGMERVGVANQFSLNAAAVYSNTEQIFNFPMNYSDAVTDTFEAAYVASGFPVDRNGYTTTTYDGEGTLTLPDGSIHNGVARVHQQVYFKDSTNPFVPIVNEYWTDNYFWYDSTQSLPLMVVSFTDMVLLATPNNDGAVYYETSMVGRADSKLNQLEGLKVYPNPVVKNFTAQFKLNTSGMVTAHLADMQGRIVAVIAESYRAAGQHELNFEIEGFQAGIYLLRINTPAGLSTKKIVIE